MSSLIDSLRKKNYFICEQGATLDDIEDAQRALGLVFAEDYRTYLQECGTASFEGHELTGISKDVNLDVVNVTTKNLLKNPSIKDPLYVIEETHIDGIVIWQSPTGEIYQIIPRSPAVMIANSLGDYLRLEKLC